MVEVEGGEGGSEVGRGEDGDTEEGRESRCRKDGKQIHIRSMGEQAIKTVEELVDAAAHHSVLEQTIDLGCSSNCSSCNRASRAGSFGGRGGRRRIGGQMWR